MPTLTVGPNSTYPTIAAAMLAASASDTIQLQSGYKNEHATVTHSGMTIIGGTASTGIVLQLATGVAALTLTGLAPIRVLDASDGNNIIGNGGNNIITVSDGADAVNGGLGIDRLVVDYHLATGAVTGDSTTNFTEAGGTRLVTITDGTFEHMTILTGSGADTITTGAGNDIINVGDGANTVTAGQGANKITGGNDSDTITALDGGNTIDGGNGTNTITSGNGRDVITGGLGADTVMAGGGNDLTTVRGGADSADSGAGNDRLVVSYAAFNTAVTGGVTGGTLLSGYSGHIADLAGNTIDFNGTENFTILTGNGADTLATGDGNDVIRSGGGADQLTTGAGADKLFGQGGKDNLNGGAGNDFLTGGFGKDMNTGGTGADRFIFTSLAESKVLAASRDTIVDFKHGQHDRIDLHAIDAMSGSGNQAFHFTGLQAFHHEKGELRYAVSNGNAFVYGDVNGDGKADFAITLLHVSHLGAGDFIL